MLGFERTHLPARSLFFNHLTDFSSLPQVTFQALFPDIKPFSRVESYSGFNSEGQFYQPD
jgi:hypothetical protein